MGGTAPPGAALSNLRSRSAALLEAAGRAVEDGTGFEGWMDCVLGCLAFAAASRLAWRMAVVRGVSVLVVVVVVGAGAVRGVEVEEVVVDGFEDAAAVDERGLEGVDAVEGVGVDAAGGPPSAKMRFCLISPYSFHSSTSSRS